MTYKNGPKIEKMHFSLQRAKIGKVIEFEILILFSQWLIMVNIGQKVKNACTIFASD